MYDFADKERFNGIVTEFSFFAKKVLMQMKTLKKNLRDFRDNKTLQIANN